MSRARIAPGVIAGGVCLVLHLTSATALAQTTPSDSLHATVKRIENHPLGADLPPIDSITRGGRTIAASETVAGRIATEGTIEVHGTVAGSVVAIAGDVVVHPGAVIRGDAISIGGQVRLEGGTVEGEMRSLSGVGAGLARPIAADTRSPAGAVQHALALTLGWLTMLAIIGIGVLMFAGSHLRSVEEALAQRFARSFWVGLLGQLAIAPVLLLVIIALAVTVIGILLIPFAVVAYVLLVAGLLTLGFLAAANRTGAALVRASSADAHAERRARLRALMLGIVLYFTLWLLAAAFAWSPIIGGILRAIAAVVTWVALTLGLGATILTRAGTRARAQRIATGQPAEELSWSTPTPVSGVAAARRPTPVARSKDGR